MPDITEEEEEVREEIVPGVARALSPMARRILAMNPGVRTGLGTNTYMVGIDEIAVIDPGPMDQSHLDAIVGCGGGGDVGDVGGQRRGGQPRRRRRRQPRRIRRRRRVGGVVHRRADQRHPVSCA